MLEWLYGQPTENPISPRELAARFSGTVYRTGENVTASGSPGGTVVVVVVVVGGTVVVVVVGGTVVVVVGGTVVVVVVVVVGSPWHDNGTSTIMSATTGTLPFAALNAGPSHDKPDAIDS